MIMQNQKSILLFDTSIWRNKAYVLWVTTVALFQFGYLIPFVHLVSRVFPFN